MISPIVGKSPQEISNAYNQALQMTQGTPNTLEGVKETLKKNNISDLYIDKASKIALPIAKMKGMNVDDLSKSVSMLKGNNNTSNNSQSNMKKYPKL